MSQEPPLKKVRKGTKSCIECRHRKIKCTWASDRATRCENCLGRGRTCELQVYMTPTSDMVQVSSRARILHLESNVSQLWKTVRDLQARLGYETTQPPPGLQEKEINVDYDEDDARSEASDFSPANPPSHLLQLFDNRLLGSDKYDETFALRPSLGANRDKDVATLRSLMPCREDMIAITAHASWITLYGALFPTAKALSSKEEMLAEYDRLQDVKSDPIAVISLLLSIAISLQQAAPEVMSLVSMKLQDVQSLVKDVCDIVERVIVHDDDVAGTVEGLEVSLLYMRLQLGRGKIKKVWLLERRVLALAEMIGLPRSSMALNSIRDSGEAHTRAPSALLVRRAEVWESLCAIDRIAAMMWSLPLGSASTPPPKRPILDADGQVVPQAFLYHLADIASRVLELDNMYSSGKPFINIFNAAVGADQELRSLANQTPKSWWKTQWSELRADMILQYWFYYVTVRTHLQLALSYDEDHQQFAFSFNACLDACQELAQRYLVLRPTVPPGFFANPIIDLQAFTTAVFLLLTTFRAIRDGATFLSSTDTDFTMRVTDQMVSRMEAASETAGGVFARRTADAIGALKSLLQESPSSERQMTLSLPLIGRIHVSRKPIGANTSQSDPNQAVHGAWSASVNNVNNASTAPLPAIPSSLSEIEAMDSLSYSMEIPEHLPFLNDEVFWQDQWLATGDWSVQ